jgi:DNA (cytosine-5)-methyltransferase 3A
MGITVLSLFDGISCGMLALERAGIIVDNYYSSEIDDNAIKISLKNYPTQIRLGNVKNIKVEDLPKIDLLIGGSPCQGFSRAGKCLNFEDPRSALFFEYVKILNELKKINPDIKFLLENVSMKKEWKDIITLYLGVEPIEINSKVLSAQHRERVYWTNINFPDIKPTDPPLESILENINTSNFIKSNGLLFDPNIPETQRALVSVVNEEVRVSQATKLGYIIPNDYDGVNLSFPKSTSRRGRVIRRKSNCITCMGRVSVYYNKTFRYLTITEAERLQTLPEGYTAGVSDTARYKAIGNGWTVDIIAHIFKGLKERGLYEEITNTSW